MHLQFKTHISRAKIESVEKDQRNHAKKTLRWEIAVKIIKNTKLIKRQWASEYLHKI